MRRNSRNSSVFEPAEFSRRLLDWFDQHGRHDLPWQKDINPYRVWVSEIMLQQTQVSTVIPYYERFMQRFPDVQTLAAASEDDVLHHWSGLGYYARGRNLLRAAQQVVEHHSGSFPEDIDALQQLPGIGRSTAAAILSISHGSRHAILDGNVKRVLCRIEAIDTTPYESATLDRLWTLAVALTPTTRCRDYTQAIMDLGATLCSRSRPRCNDCPMQDRCKAHALGTPTAFPVPRKRKTQPVRRCRMLLIRNRHGETLLQKRPSKGLWGGLWCLPQIDDDSCAIELSERLTGGACNEQGRGELFRHTFSHYHLDIEPIFIALTAGTEQLAERDTMLWYRKGDRELGLAAPVSKLLTQQPSTQTTLPLEHA